MKKTASFIAGAVFALLVNLTLNLGLSQSPTPSPTATPAPSLSPSISIAPQSQGTVPIKPKAISAADAELLQAGMENVFRADGSQVLTVSPGTFSAFHFDRVQTSGSFIISGNMLVSGS